VLKTSSMAWRCGREHYYK